MRRFLLTLIFMIPLVILAQNTEVIWGPTYKWSSKLITRIIAKDNTGLYVSRTDFPIYRHIIIEKYNDSLAMVYSKRIMLPVRNKKPLKYEGILRVNNQLILIVSHEDLKDGKSYLLAYPIDDNGNLGQKFKILDEQQNEGKRTSAFGYALSQDSTKFLVFYSKPYAKYNNEKFSFKGYDNTLNLIWEKEIQLPYKDKFFILGDYSIDNSGNLYMIASLFPDVTAGEKWTLDKQVEKIILLMYNYQNEKISQFETNLPDKWIESIAYNINENNKELVISGYYSDTYRQTIHGVFFTTIDIKDEKVKLTSIKKFDDDFMQKMIGENKTEKGKGIKNLKFNYFFTKKDGGAYLISENIYEKKVGVMVGGGIYFDDIVIVNVNSDGVIEWIKRIPKKSYDPNFIGLYLSHAINFNKKTNTLNLVFNDNPRNFELFKNNAEKAISIGEWRYVEVALATITHDSKMTRTPLFSVKDLNGIRLVPRFFLDTGDGLITFAIKGSKYKFGKISFK